MPHANEKTGIFGTINLLSGEIEEQIRIIMERGMVAHHPRLNEHHASKLIQFTSYANIPDGPLSLIRQPGAAWFPGWLLASDSSPMESSIGQDHGWYASNRVLISMIVAMGLDAQKVEEAQKGIRPIGSVDPAWSGTATRQTGVGWQGSGQIFLVLPGNGILFRHAYATEHPKNEKMGFCHALEEALRRTSSWDPDGTLWETYLRLLVNWKDHPENEGKKIHFGHQEDVWDSFQKNSRGQTTGFLRICPHCRTPVHNDGMIISDPDPKTLSQENTYFDCLTCGEQTRLIDACGLTYLYQEDRSNLHVMTAFSCFLEHLLLYAWCEHYLKHMRKHPHDKQYEDDQHRAGSIFVMDGPLALFGTTGRFVKAFRNSVQKAVGAGATIFGIVKTGRVCDFLSGLPEEMIGPPASYFIIPDRVRLELVETFGKPSFYGFGEMSYYGHDVVVRTERGLRFLLSVAPPQINPTWWKRHSIPESMEAKSKVINTALTTKSFYGNIMDKKQTELFATQQQWFDYINPLGLKKNPTAPLYRVISTLEHVESLMYQQSSIPQVFAHMLAGIQGKLMQSYLKQLTINHLQAKDDKQVNQEGMPIDQEKPLQGRKPGF